MSLANATRIKYQGEILCCLDQTEVKAVEPYVCRKFPHSNIIKRLWDWIVTIVIRKTRQVQQVDATRVWFKDGTSIILKIPFWEFVNEFC